MKCYYARPISIYGTKQDERNIAMLKKAGFDILDPNQDEHQERYKTEGMELFTNLVKECDMLAFASFPCLSIPAGVKKEIDTAYEIGLPVFEIPTILSGRILSVEDTREYLKLTGIR